MERDPARATRSPLFGAARTASAFLRARRRAARGRKKDGPKLLRLGPRVGACDICRCGTTDVATVPRRCNVSSTK